MKRITLSIILLISIASTTMAQHSSVFSSGRWWKLSVTASGVYRITTGDIPALSGTRVDSIAVYGMGSGMLSVYNSETSTDGLRQLAIEVKDRNGNGLFDAEDEILFYGEGAEEWRYNSGLQRWTFTHHAYATENCYYLTASATAPKRIATAAPVNADTLFTTHTVVTHVDNDLVNIYKTGQLWMGEKLSTAVPSRTFDLHLPGSGISNVKLRWAVATSGTLSGVFSLSTNGYNRGEDTLISSNPYRTIVDAIPVASSSYTFTLRFTPSDNGGSGYLDFIELTAEAALTFSGGQQLIRNDRFLHNNVSFRMTQTSSASARVWEVTEAGQEREMALSNSTWSDTTGIPRTYIAFDDYSYLAPEVITPLDNQDLHGCAAADLVIVTHPSFLENASRLATLHELFDTLNTLVVTDAQVYNEFSSGKQDPMAIRAMLRWMKEQYPARPPRYLVLFGKGSYDNRNLLGNNIPTVVTYETPLSVKSRDDDNKSYASDDMLGYLAPDAHGSSSETLEVSVGRLPARDVEEAALMVDKIEGYITRRDLIDENNRGDWRNYVALLADDADPSCPGDSLFVHSSEVVATAIKQTLPQMNIDRLYADAYHQSSGAIGSYYPDLNNALRQRINYGCLLINYIGHGSEAYIGTERYIEPADVAAYSNTDRLPLFVTSTCSYGHYDKPDELCGAEACMLAPAAAIGVIAASRPISHIERFNKDVVLYALDPANTIGDALRKAKNRTSVHMSIALIGDPALRLSQPTHRVRVTHINTTPVDDTTDIMADVLSRVTVSGEIQDADGQLVSDFDGTIYPVVYDREMRATTLANDNPGTEVSFWQQKTVLYKGSHSVSGGRFEYSFIVPMDVSYRYDYAKLSHYAKSPSDHATGSFTHLMLGGMSDSAYDHAEPPAIRLFLGDTNFRAGGLTGPSPTLLALITDSAGINIGTGLGHDITAVVDDNPGSLIVLNDLFQPDIADGRCGSVSYTLQGLAPGRHTVTVKAWNIFGLSSSATVPFTVHSNDTLTFSELTCAPNPATTRATFSLRVNNPADILSAELQIYNFHGQLLYTHTPTVSAGAFLVGPVYWDVSSVPPGLYLARMVLSCSDGETRQVTTKCIVR